MMRKGFEKASLIIIDVQNDFCPGGSLPVWEGDRVVPVINRIIGRFSKVVATQDWHPKNHISFASNHREKRPFEVVNIKGIEQTLWPDHCVQGTAGADFHPDLNRNAIDLVLRKGTRSALDSYSAFFENDKRTLTGLSGFLSSLGIEEVYVCGLAYDVCVFFTAMDSIGLGFRTILIGDASRGVDVPPGNVARTTREMEKAGVMIITSDEVL